MHEKYANMSSVHAYLPIVRAHLHVHFAYPHIFRANANNNERSDPDF